MGNGRHAMVARHAADGQFQPLGRGRLARRIGKGRLRRGTDSAGGRLAYEWATTNSSTIAEDAASQSVPAASWTWAPSGGSVAPAPA